MKIRFKRFTKPHLLKQIDRGLLVRFFDHFKNDFNGNALALPRPEVPDSNYFASLARVLMSPEWLPDSLNDALFAIDEMSTQNAQARLEAAEEWPEIQALLRADS